MSVFDVLGFVLLGLAVLVLALRLFRVLECSWTVAVLPLFLFFVYQAMVAVVAGLGNYLGYLGGLAGRFRVP